MHTMVVAGCHKTSDMIAVQINLIKNFFGIFFSLLFLSAHRHYCFRIQSINGTRTHTYSYCLNRLMRTSAGTFCTAWHRCATHRKNTFDNHIFCFRYQIPFRTFTYLLETIFSLLHVSIGNFYVFFVIDF